MDIKTNHRRRRITVLAAPGAGAAVAAVTAMGTAAPAQGAVATGGIGTAPADCVKSG